MSEIITEATGIPDSMQDTATETQTEAAPLSTEISQEDMLAEIRTAEKENRPTSFVPKRESKEESSTPINGHEQKLKEKHAGDYKPPEERKVAVAREATLSSKIEGLQQQLQQLQEALKSAPQTPENQAEQLRSEMALHSLEQRYTENMEEYTQLIKQDLEGKYNADPEFKAQHDHYSPIIADVDGYEEFNSAILGSPYRIEILADLYNWLDTGGNLQRFVSSPKEARMQALNYFVSGVKYKPRINQPTSATPTPTSKPASMQVADRIKPPTVAPGNGVGGGSYDPNNQESVLKRIREQERKAGSK
jgi:hypothetical protein